MGVRGIEMSSVNNNLANSVDRKDHTMFAREVKDFPIEGVDGSMGGVAEQLGDTIIFGIFIGFGIEVFIGEL